MLLKELRVGHKVEKEDKPEGDFYYIDLAELESRLGKKIHSGKLREATDGLVGKVYQIDRPNGGYLQVSIAASAEYIPHERMVEIELSNKIKPYLINVTNTFTVYQLQTVLTLKSKYSKRIYQMLCQWQSSGYFVTTVSKLRSQFELEDKYDGFSMFKKKVLDVAQEELNETDKKFTYKVSKQGRKYNKLEFFFASKKEAKKPKETKPVALSSALTEESKPFLHPEEQLKEGSRTLYERLTNDFKLEHSHIEKVFKAYSQMSLNKVLYALKLDFNDKQVINKQVYTLRRLGMENESFKL